MIIPIIATTHKTIAMIMFKKWNIWSTINNPNSTAAINPSRIARPGTGNSFLPQYKSFSPTYTTKDTINPTATDNNTTNSEIFQISDSPESVSGEKYIEFARYTARTVSRTRNIIPVNRNCILFFNAYFPTSYVLSYHIII